MARFFIFLHLAVGFIIGVSCEERIQLFVPAVASATTPSGIRVNAVGSAGATTTQRSAQSPDDSRRNYYDPASYGRDADDRPTETDPRFINPRTGRYDPRLDPQSASYDPYYYPDTAGGNQPSLQVDASGGYGSQDPSRAGPQYTQPLHQSSVDQDRQYQPYDPYATQNPNENDRQDPYASGHDAGAGGSAGAGYDARGQPGYPSGSQPDYDSRGQPGYDSRGQPGYDSRGQPGYDASRGQPGYDASRGQPGYDPYGSQPGYDASRGQPGYGGSAGYDSRYGQGQPGRYPQAGGSAGYDNRYGGRDPYHQPQTPQGYDSRGNPYPPEVKTIVLSENSVYVWWIDPTNPQAGRKNSNSDIKYTVKYQKLYDPSGNTEGTQETTSNREIHIKNLDSGTDYSFSVKAEANGRMSSWSNPVRNRTLEELPTQPPSDIKVEARETDATVTITPAPGSKITISSYLFLYAPSGGRGGPERRWLEQQVSGYSRSQDGSVTFTLSGLQPGEEYFYTVQSTNSRGSSPFSEIASFKTQGYGTSYGGGGGGGGYSERYPATPAPWGGYPTRPPWERPQEQTRPPWERPHEVTRPSWERPEEQTRSPWELPADNQERPEETTQPPYDPYATQPSYDPYATQSPYDPYAPQASSDYYTTQDPNGYYTTPDYGRDRDQQGGDQDPYRTQQPGENTPYWEAATEDSRGSGGGVHAGGSVNIDGSGGGGVNGGAGGGRHLPSPGGPPAPTDLKVDDLGGGEIALQWTPPAAQDISGYEIYYTYDASSADDLWVIETARGDESQTIMAGLNPNSYVSIKMRAINGAGKGEFSETINWYVQAGGQVEPAVVGDPDLPPVDVPVDERRTSSGGHDMHHGQGDHDHDYAGGEDDHEDDHRGLHVSGSAGVGGGSGLHAGGSAGVGGGQGIHAGGSAGVGGGSGLHAGGSASASGSGAHVGGSASVGGFGVSGGIGGGARRN